MARKHSECSKCGAPRTMLVTPTVIQQSDTQRIAQSFKTLCIPCFLKLIGLEEQSRFENLDNRYKDSL